MTSLEYREAIEALEFCEKNGWTGFGGYYRDLLNLADREGKLPPEALVPEEPGEEVPEETLE